MESSRHPVAFAERVPLVVGLLAIVLASSGLKATAQGVHVQDGNIYYDASGAVSSRRLTTSGLDSDPALSPRGAFVAFVRKVPDRTIATGSGNTPATQLWIVNTNGSNARSILMPQSDNDPKRTLAGIHDLHFSPDGRQLYFLSAAWATSDAVHAIDMDSGKETFVVPGNSLAVVAAGSHAGDLLVQQHRDRTEGGSYDWLWLLHPDGHEVVAVGDPGSPGFKNRLDTLLDGSSLR